MHLTDWNMPVLRMARERGPGWLVACGFIACAAGLIVEDVGGELPWPRFVESMVLAGLMLLLAWPLRRGLRWSWPVAMAIIAVLGLTFFGGVRELLAVGLLGLAAVAIGSLLVPAHAPARLPLSACAGLVLIGGVAGWLLPLPVFRSYLLAPLLSGLILWRRHAVRGLLMVAKETFCDEVTAAAGPAWFATGMLALVSSAAWLPTVQADDLAYHLALPSQLQFTGFYHADPALQIWALAPWLGDVLQGLVQVLAGGEARGALNVVWLLITASMLWHMTRYLRAPPAAAWLTVALFASLPTLASLLFGMQTELAAAALLVALAWLIQTRSRHVVLLAAVLVGGLIALKFGQLVAALVLLLWALWRTRGRMDWPRLPFAFVLLVLVAGSSYVYAGVVSGNPLLPLFNHVFNSPFLPPEQLHDARWHQGFGWSLPWRITFDTGRYQEAHKGGFGFLLVALSGAWLLAMLRPSTRGLTVAATLVLVLPLLAIQYARYAFPGLVLMLPALMAACSTTLAPRHLQWLMVSLCVCDLAFQANSNWLLRVGSVKILIRNGGESEAVYRRHTPERALIAGLRRIDGSDSVVLALDARTPDIAELGQRGRTVAWYAPALRGAAQRADTDETGAAWQALFVQEQVRWLLLRPERLSAAQRAALVRSSAQRVDGVGAAELWQIDVAHGGPTP